MDFSGPGSCKCTSVFSGSRYGKSGGSHDHLFISWPGERELAAVDVLAVVDVDHVNDLLVPDRHVDDAVVADPDPHDACRAFQRLASWRLGVGAERVECLGDPAPHYRVELREMLARRAAQAGPGMRSSQPKVRFDLLPLDRLRARLMVIL